MENYSIETIINLIIEKKLPVFFVSPHLDDAMLSAGGLISFLSKKTKVTVISVFTQGANKPSLSAKAFIKQCGYTNAELLFADRRKEDIEVFSSIKVKPIHLSFPDALFRKKEKINIVDKILGKFLPEFHLIYPTYKFHIAKGTIARDDYFTIDKVANALKEVIKDPKNSIIFAPLAIGNHVDHQITKLAVNKVGESVYWYDEPYTTREDNRTLLKYPLLLSNTKEIDTKTKLLLNYRTQIKALFGEKQLPELEEHFVLTDIYNSLFPLAVGEYGFVKELKGLSTKKSYRFGLYKNAEGKLAFAKFWKGKLKNKEYLFLKNEASCLQFLDKIPQKQITKKAFPHISYPLYIDMVETKDTLLLLSEYKHGNNLTKIENSKKIKIISEVMSYFNKLNENQINTKSVSILHRGIFYQSIMFFTSFLINCIRHPRFIKTFMQSFSIFIRNIPLLAKNNIHSFVHRDIGVKNILLYKEEITILDFQLSCFSNAWLEHAVMYIKSYHDNLPAQDVFESIVQPKMQNQTDITLFFIYCLFVSTYEQATTRGAEFNQSFAIMKSVIEQYKLLKGNSPSLETKQNGHNWLFVKKITEKVRSMRIGGIVLSVSVLLICIPVLLLVMKGNKGTPIAYQTERVAAFGGPFELSISAARFALTESIVKNHSLLLSESLAAFSAPDVAVYKGKFISLFTPGVSFLGIPFYLIGLPFGMPQLSAYFLNIVVGLINVFLIERLCLLFGANKKVGLLGGLIFLFATNSLAYTSTFTQHHITIALLLLLILITYKKPTFLWGLTIGAIYGFGLFIDVPNIFLFFPVVCYAIVESIHVEKLDSDWKLSVKTSLFSILLGTVVLFSCFGIYDYATTGSFTKIAQFIGQARIFKPALQNTIVDDQSNVNDIKVGLSLPFKTRNELFGAYILLLSDERSWLYYCPIVLIGIIGLVLMYKKEEYRKKTVLIISLIGGNILLYAMFGDPWGGWAFGSRYLLPSAAILSCFAAIAFARYRRNIPFILLFVLLTVYSLRISLLGALTTIAIPPKVEATHLLNPVPWTSQYNQNLINANYTSSLIYNVFIAHIMKVKAYFLALYTYCALILLGLMALISTERIKND